MPTNLDFTAMSSQAILDLANPTKEYREMMSIWPPINVNWNDRTSTVAKLRVQTEIADEMDEQDPQVEESIENISARDGYQLQLRTFRSKKASATLGPLIVLWHGGGLCIGSPTMVADTARQLVKKFFAVVVAPSYRLAPEHPWPTPIDDGWDSLNWIRQNAASLRADPSKGFIIGGISAGASMSLAYAHLARDEKLEPKITGVWSACGSPRPVDASELEDKYKNRYFSRTQQECLNNPVLSKEMIKLMADCVQADVKSKMYASLLWPDGDGHKGLPRIYQQLCGRDVNRDEGLILDDILKQEGVPSRLDLYPGLPHCFWIVLRHIPEFARWEKDTVDGFEWLLDRSK